MKHIYFIVSLSLLLWCYVNLLDQVYEIKSNVLEIRCRQQYSTFKEQVECYEILSR